MVGDEAYLGPHSGEFVSVLSHHRIACIQFLNQTFCIRSEGKSLTQDDEKSYWGKIKEVPKSVDDADQGGDADTGDSKKVSIKGAVMVGWGLEPCSVGRFKMTEIEDILEDEDDDEEEEEEEYEALSDEAVMESALNFDSLLDIDEPKDDDDNDYESFEVPGAFE